MDKRPIIYSMEQGRSFDVASSWQDTMVGDSQIAQAVLGATTTVASGFAASQTATPSLVINLAAGAILEEAAIDATAYGPLQANTNQILQYGSAAAQTVTLSTSGLTAGQSQWALIQVTFAQVDSIATNDPNGGVLLYYNSSNPSQPFQGPGNSGAQQNTLRSGVASVTVVYGVAATTGSEVPPSASAGAVGLYLIDLTFGQTQITNSEILVAGPSVGANVPSNYPYAPFLAGLLNSHHSGTPGQAPKINLATETQGVLPANSVVGTIGNGASGYTTLTYTLNSGVTNNTGRPLVISGTIFLNIITGNSATITVKIDGTAIWEQDVGPFSTGASSLPTPVYFIAPIGSTYEVDFNTSGGATVASSTFYSY